MGLSRDVALYTAVDLAKYRNPTSAMSFLASLACCCFRRSATRAALVALSITVIVINYPRRRQSRGWGFTAVSLFFRTISQKPMQL